MLGPPPFADVGERQDSAAAAGHIDGSRPVLDRKQRPVPPHQPVFGVDRLAGRARQQHGALAGRIKSPVWAPVVDRLVGRLTQDVGHIPVAKDGHRGGVGEPDQPGLVDHRDRLDHALQNRGRELVRAPR